jgi:hypothetical protein
MGLAHGLQLAEVLPGHPVPLGRKGNEVTTCKHGERCRGIVRKVKSLLLPPLH